MFLLHSLGLLSCNPATVCLGQGSVGAAAFPLAWPGRLLLSLVGGVGAPEVSWFVDLSSWEVA